jgi:predicted nuclease of restriction endonuclease-like (RecB) superfamily
MLFDRVAEILDAARTVVSRSVNTTMVQAYWLIGRNIVEVEQAGATRAGYGDEVVKRLASRMTVRYGPGYTATSIKRMRQFYKAYPNGSRLPEATMGGENGAAVRHLLDHGALSAAARHLSPGSRPFPPQLSWTHYRLLLTIGDEAARAFYEIEAAREGWTTRDLERQVASLLYERLARSRDKEGVLALAREGQQVTTPASVLKDPFVLEFLDLAARPQWRERDLEQAIIDRLESFLLELGKGFCFVARQKRITLDGDHFFVDLVFYNRLLRCFVLVDLKLDKLTHQDLGQMQMYVNLFDATERADGEAPTVGIVLCSDKNDAMVRITLPKDSQVHASRYQLYLPTEEELTRELAREREAAEHQLLAAALDRADEHDS